MHVDSLRSSGSVGSLTQDEAWARGERTVSARPTIHLPGQGLSTPDAEAPMDAPEACGIEESGEMVEARAVSGWRRTRLPCVLTSRCYAARSRKFARSSPSWSSCSVSEAVLMAALRGCVVPGWARGVALCSPVNAVGGCAHVRDGVGARTSTSKRTRSSLGRDLHERSRRRGTHEQLWQELTAQRVDYTTRLSPPLKRRTKTNSSKTTA